MPTWMENSEITTEAEGNRIDNAPTSSAIQIAARKRTVFSGVIKQEKTAVLEADIESCQNHVEEKYKPNIKRKKEDYDITPCYPAQIDKVTKDINIKAEPLIEAETPSRRPMRQCVKARIDAKDNSLDNSISYIRKSTRKPKPKNYYSPDMEREEKPVVRKINIEETNNNLITKNEGSSFEKQSTRDSSPESDEREETSGTNGEESEEEEDEESSSSDDDNSEDEYLPPFAGKINQYQLHSENTRIATSSSEKVTHKNITHPKVPLNRTMNDSQELLNLIENDLARESILYRAGQNSMFMPTIEPNMLSGNGTEKALKNVSASGIPEQLFKFTRANNGGKAFYADPKKVREIINAVKKRPIIWDQRLVSHQNALLVRRAWIELDIELGTCEEYTLTRRKQVWKSKKDYYASSYINGTLAKWAFSRDMEFYNPMIPFRTLHSCKPLKDGSRFKNDFDKLILGNKRILCSSDDKMNVLGFLLKSIHENASCNPEMLSDHLKEIATTFERNMRVIEERYGAAP